MRIRLSGEDRKAYGVDEEWLTFDGGRLSAREAALLQDIGYDTPTDWYRAFAGTDVVEDGQPVYVLDADGQPLTRVDGTPVQKRRRDWLAECAAVWLALRRAGKPVPWADCDVDIQSLHFEPDDEPEVGGGGKDPSTPDSPSPDA